jgi:hypothetical protein
MARGTRDWGQVTGGPQSVAELPTYVLAMVNVVVCNNPGLLNMLNPAGSGKLVKVRDVLWTVSAVLSFTGALASVARAERITVLGTGTLLTPQPFDSGDPASVVTAKELITVNPVLGAQVGAWFAMFNESAAVGDHAFGIGTGLVNPYSHKGGQNAKPLTLLQGEGLSFRDAFGRVELEAHLMVIYTEEPV